MLHLVLFKLWQATAFCGLFHWKKQLVVRSLLFESYAMIPWGSNWGWWDFWYIQFLRYTGYYGLYIRYISYKRSPCTVSSNPKNDTFELRDWSSAHAKICGVRSTWNLNIKMLISNIYLIEWWNFKQHIVSAADPLDEVHFIKNWTKLRQKWLEDSCHNSKFI